MSHDELNTLENMRRRYSYGKCFTFAIALAKNLGVRKLTIYNKKGWKHALVEYEETFYDVSGETTPEKIAEKYGDKKWWITKDLLSEHTPFANPREITYLRQWLKEQEWQHLPHNSGPPLEGKPFKLPKFS